MKLCSKIRVRAIETDLFERVFITDAELLDTSLVAAPCEHDHHNYHVQAGDVIYVLSGPLVVR